MINIEEVIKELAYNKKQEEAALKEWKEVEPKVKKVLSTLVYNKDYGKELSILTTPDFNLKFRFEKE